MRNSFFQINSKPLKKFRTNKVTLLEPLMLNRPRLFLWLLILPLILLSACSSGNANAYSYSITPENYNKVDYNEGNFSEKNFNNGHINKDNKYSTFVRLNILGSFLIKANTKDSLPIIELSDLAWDEDEQLLYAISDEGLLYHLKLDFKNKKLQAVTVIAAMNLRDKEKLPLKGKYSDAEGLAIRHSNNGKRGDSELIISFENKPRIAVYSTNGHYLKNVKTVKKLRKRKYFRSNNKALESVTLHPTYGILTASEKPLKANPLNKQTIYSSKGKEWHFTASKEKNSSITAIEVISKDKILILERAYNGIFSPIVIRLRQLNINKCNNLNLCETEEIAKFDSSDGWILDNFEGLTHFRDNQYLMVSDNNNNPFQKTLLVLFEIVDK